MALHIFSTIPETRFSYTDYGHWFLAGFSYKDIQLITNWQSAQSLMTMKNRIKKDIIDAKCKDEELFLKLLRTKNDRRTS